ncbi:MAG: hypothetical protein MZV49_05345 [Rhodopseudomonas palustris]|nr:hypothetical protein [Rhodopseudomonas palustris]
MDTLTAITTAVCQRVDAVRVLRVVDAGMRREALQRQSRRGVAAARSSVVWQRRGRYGTSG